VAALVSWGLTRDFGSRNVFERQAGLADGGYSAKPLRPALRRLQVRDRAARAALTMEPGSRSLSS
jgi:hypothetical protein